MEQKPPAKGCGERYRKCLASAGAAMATITAITKEGKNRLKTRRTRSPMLIFPGRRLPAAGQRTPSTYDRRLLRLHYFWVGPGVLEPTDGALRPPTSARSCGRLAWRCTAA